MWLLVRRMRARVLCSVHLSGRGRTGWDFAGWNQFKRENPTAGVVWQTYGVLGRPTRDELIQARHGACPSPRARECSYIRCLLRGNQREAVSARHRLRQSKASAGRRKGGEGDSGQGKGQQLEEAHGVHGGQLTISGAPIPGRPATPRAARSSSSSGGRTRYLHACLGV